MNLVRFRHLAVPAVLLAAGTALSACSPAGDASDSTPIFTTVDEGTPITAGAPMNPFNLTNNVFNGYDVEELGWPTNNPADSNQTLPGLAASWSLSPDGRTLTVHLQPRARWSNGQPVTAQDVKTSAAIWFTQDSVQLYNLGAVTVVNSKTVRFTQVPGAHNNQFESGILQDPSFIVPASVKSAPDYATYLADIYQGDYAVGFWLTAIGPGAYSTFHRIYGTYDGYVPAGVTLKRYPTGNSTADNFLNAPETVHVPGLGTVNPGRLTYRLTSVNLNSQAGLRRQNTIMAKLIAATNYSLPVIQLWDYINVQFVNNKRFADWPTGHDAQLNLSPGVWMTYGYVHPR